MGRYYEAYFSYFCGGYGVDGLCGAAGIFLSDGNLLTDGKPVQIMQVI